METKNLAIGENAGLSATKLTNSTLIGINAGAGITEGDGIVIIGDDIRSLDIKQKNVLFIRDKIAIGKTLFGEPINLFDVISKHLGIKKEEEFCCADCKKEVTEARAKGEKVGSDKLKETAEESYNTYIPDGGNQAFGYSALSNTTTGTNCTAFGYSAVTGLNNNGTSIFSQK